MTDSQQTDEVDQAKTEPRPAEVSFVTTAHFALQSARSSTIIESTGRANVFLSSVTGGLVALGLMATATGVGAAFYAFGLIILPALAFVALVTFARVLQSSIEDHGYARRIARLRGYYFEHAPELTRFLLSVPSAERLAVQGRRHGHWHWQGLLTVATMVARTGLDDVCGRRNCALCRASSPTADAMPTRRARVGPALRWAPRPLPVLKKGRGRPQLA